MKNGVHLQGFKGYFEGTKAIDIKVGDVLVWNYGLLSKVISNLGMSEKDMDSIKKNVSVKAVSDTELIEITVKNADPEKAALIANEIAKVFSEKVVEIYNISNIYVLDRAEASNVPCSNEVCLSR